jgi:hypothetical protein
MGAGRVAQQERQEDLYDSGRFSFLDLGQHPTVSEPFSDGTVVGLAAFGRAVLAEVNRLTVKGDDRLAVGLVQPVRRECVFGHRNTILSAIV